MGLFDEVLDNVGKEYKGGKGFEYGTHEVVIGTAEAKTKKTQKVDAAAIIEVVVFDAIDNEKTATCFCSQPDQRGGARDARLRAHFFFKQHRVN